MSESKFKGLLIKTVSSTNAIIWLHTSLTCPWFLQLYCSAYLRLFFRDFHLTAYVSISLQPLVSNLNAVKKKGDFNKRFVVRAQSSPNRLLRYCACALCYVVRGTSACLGVINHIWITWQRTKTLEKLHQPIQMEIFSYLKKTCSSL